MFRANPGNHRQYRPFLALFLLSLSSLAAAQSIEAITYNIRYDNPEDGENTWDRRKAGLVGQLKFYEPDLFGIQEGEYHQVQYIDEGMPDYAWVGVGRDDGAQGGEFSAIFYDKKRFEVLESSTFWLSETPAEPSLGWDAAIKRVCTYARFRDRESGREFWMFNTHFDHIGELARENSAALIRDRIGQIVGAGEPFLLMGDFNALPGSPPTTILMAAFDDSRKLASDVVFGPEATRGGFYVSEAIDRRIDYIFLSPGDWNVSKYAVLTDSRDGKYYSDHLPVYAEIALKAD